MPNNNLPMYAREIEKYWKYKEKQRKKICFTSPQIQLRRHLVVWLKNVAQKLKVSYRTLHLAIYILDMFMDDHSINKDRLGFVALVCLMLAAKFDDLGPKIPIIPILNKYDGNRYPKSDFVKVEVMVLKFLNFDLTQPTAAHFAEYYIMGAVLPQDLQSTHISSCRLGEVSCSTVKEFLDIALKEAGFLHLPPSQVAAACVLATRKKMNFTPSWTPVLEQMTGYVKENVSNFATYLLQKLQEECARRKRHATSPDHGYISESPE